MGFGDLSRIGTNVQSLNAYRTLTQTNMDLGERQLRLATGSDPASVESNWRAAGALAEVRHRPWPTSATPRACSRLPKAAWAR